MMGRKDYAIWFALLWFAMCGSALKANMVDRYELEIFTGEGGYFDDLNLYIDVSNGGAGQIDFSFHNKTLNESLIDSSIARIYFDDDDGLLLGIANIAGPGTSFSQSAAPKNLPGGKSLGPAFVATGEFSIGGAAPPPKNGVNPGECVTITFDLINGGTLGDVIGGLNSGTLRIGAHIIALPDDLSGSAIAVPEPATLMLLGSAGLWIFTRKRRSI